MACVRYSINGESTIHNSIDITDNSLTSKGVRMERGSGEGGVGPNTWPMCHQLPSPAWFRTCDHANIRGAYRSTRSSPMLPWVFT